MKKLSVLLVALLMGSVLMAQDATIPVADSLLHKGHYLEALKMAESIAADAEAAGDQPTLLKAWYIMAEAYFQSGDEEKAVTYVAGVMPLLRLKRKRQPRPI